MIGQEKIINKLYSYSLDTLPKTMLFLGSFGCGKHTLCKELSNHFNLNLIDITANISFECMTDIYKNVNPTLYVINMIELTEKKQNMILKFIEEPIDGSFVVLLSESKSQLLDTICNRCYIFQFEQYKKSDLIKIVPNVNIDNLEYVDDLTPGKLLIINPDQYKMIEELAVKFVLNIKKASLPNTLTLLNKFNYKDEFDKFDIKTWFDLIQAKTLDLYKTEFNEDYLTLKLITLKYSKRLIDPRINKYVLMENYLVNVWSKMRGVQ